MVCLKTEEQSSEGNLKLAIRLRLEEGSFSESHIDVKLSPGEMSWTFLDADGSPPL